MAGMTDWDAVVAELGAGRAVVAGVLSGTSADGIDVGLAEARIEAGRLVGLVPRAFETVPFERVAPPDLAERLRAALAGSLVLGPRELTLLDRDLGRAFGRAARAVADAAGLKLALVASHGQTLWHHDGVEPSGAATLQLGDGDEVAEAAGAPVAADFRRRDIAAGGGGAPLSALADPLVFAGAPRPLALLNLGGIANLTLVRKRRLAPIEGVGDRGSGRQREVGHEAIQQTAHESESKTEAEDVTAFDVGPANALLDGLARALLGCPFDRDGAAAASGTAHAGLTSSILAHPFFAAPTPKSTGRDTFGRVWLAEVEARARGLGLSPSDTLASAALAVARSVARDVVAWTPWLGDGEAPAPLYVAGGGVHHLALQNALAGELAAQGHAAGLAPRPVGSTAALGVSPDGREAWVFAVLGLRCLLGEGSTRTSATGARPGRVLGKLCHGPPRHTEPGSSLSDSPLARADRERAVNR